MPWHVEKRDNEFCVIKDDDNSNEGCHPTREEANNHMAALYANEPKAEAGGGLTFEAETIEVTFDAPEGNGFRVNPDRRTISGLMVPWNRTARPAGSRYRYVFPPGSLRWSDASRVKLNIGHEREAAVAYATRLEATATGLDGSFKVARGPEGDRALTMAEDRVLDGFSIEVSFEDEDGFHVDPSDDSTRVVDRGRLTGAALTGFPAFDDARVMSVAASRKGQEMPEEEVKTTEEALTFETALTRLAEAQTANSEQLAENLAASVGESISAGMKAALESAGDERGVVRATRYQVMREEPIYRFNGTGNSLVRDAWYAQMEQDTDAIDRVAKYRRQQEEMVKLVNSGQVSFTPQTTSTASQVIPPGYRPDLYVTQLQQNRPLVNAASQGSIANATPFTVPTFTSATSVTADHVEGTNPSDGSLAFGTKTVTPQAISGRLTLSREIVDSSNPAIDQIAIAAMRESYARQTEAKVYTLLNGANGAGGTITTGFVPSGAQASTYVGTTGTPPALLAGIRGELARYPFNRFASPNVALMGQSATSILAKANDSTGRPMFPYVGATNAAGIGRAADQAWSVDGLTFIPAWAATGTAAGDTQIFILNSSDLWVWESPLLTFRFEEKQGPANIELNVFGYFATHLLRPVGLSGIRIT